MLDTLAMAALLKGEYKKAFEVERKLVKDVYGFDISQMDFEV